MIVRLAYSAPHMTHAQIAKRVGVSRSTVMRVLANRRRGPVGDTYPARTRRALEQIENRSNWRTHLDASLVTSLVLRRVAADARFPGVRELAAAENAHPAALRCLVGDSWDWNRRSAAANPNCPAGGLARAARDPEASVRAAAAANSNCPAAMIAALARDDVREVRAAAAANPSCPPKSAAALTRDAVPEVRAAAAANPSCPLGLLAQLAEDPSTAAAVAANPGCPAELLAQLSQRRDGGVLRSLAANRSAPARVLELLAAAGGIVTQRVASNPSTPAEVLDHIAESPLSSQRAAGYARENLYARRNLHARAAGVRR